MSPHAEHSLSSKSVCANHFRRRWPRRGREVHKGQTGLLFSRPGQKEPHTSQSSVYLRLALGSNKITAHSQEHSGLLIYFRTDLLPFPFQRLYDIFILDPSLLPRTQHQREHPCSGGGVPAHVKPGDSRDEADPARVGSMRSHYIKQKTPRFPCAPHQSFLAPVSKSS